MVVKKKSKKAVKKRERIMQFKISLKGVEPEIWRRVQAGSNMNMRSFAVAILLAMGWHNSHLHEFEIKGRRYGIAEDYLGEGGEHLPEDEVLYRLEDMKLNPEEQFLFEYDFGDGWEHNVVFEGYVDKKKRLNSPLCIDGARNCPPEDSGGVRGYLELVESLKSPGTEKYEQMFGWLGGEYDPEFFSIDRLNHRLKKTDAYVRYGFMNDKKALDEIRDGYEHDNCGMGLSLKDLHKDEMLPLLMKQDKEKLVKIIYIAMSKDDELADELISYFGLDKESDKFSKAHVKRKTKKTGKKKSEEKSCPSWDELDPNIKRKILENAYCRTCGTAEMGDYSVGYEKGVEILRGKCKKCNGPVVRVLSD